MNQVIRARLFALNNRILKKIEEELYTKQKERKIRKKKKGEEKLISKLFKSKDMSHFGKALGY